MFAIEFVHQGNQKDQEPAAQQDVVASGVGLGRRYFSGAASLAAGLVIAVFLIALDPWTPTERTILSSAIVTAAVATTVPSGLLLLAGRRAGGRRSDSDAGLLVLLVGSGWLLPARMAPVLAGDGAYRVAPLLLGVAPIIVLLAYSASRADHSFSPDLVRRAALVAASIAVLTAAAFTVQSTTSLDLVKVVDFVCPLALGLSAGLMLLAGYRAERWSLTFIGMELLGLEMGEILASQSADVTSAAWLGAMVLALVGASIGTLGVVAIILSSVESTRRELLGVSLDQVRLSQQFEHTQEQLHDLRAGLFSVEAFAGALGSAAVTEDERRQTSLLIAELTRLRELVAVTRPVAHQCDLSVDLANMVGARAALPGPVIVARIEPHLVCDASGPDVLEAVQNLLDNARLHADATRVELTAVASPGRVRITVADDGAGFEPEFLPSVFERGFSTSADGTGLGLFIVRRTVEAMGGTVAAMNRRTGGALVQIEVPSVNSGRPEEGVALPALLRSLAEAQPLDLRDR